MAGEIDPFIQGKLDAFRGRYRLLQLVRGIGCVVLSFLFVLLAVAAADYFVVMEDNTRLWLSGAVYFIGVLALWLGCIRPMWKRLEVAALAAMIENEAPALRTQLLSAVELTGDGEGMDSPALRKRARERVIEKLQGIDTTGLMPARLKKSCLSAGIVALVLVLAAVGMASYPAGRTLLLRAFAPMANVDRVSRNQIAVLSPEGGDAMVPENDQQAIEISVTGPALKSKPTLESRTVGAEEAEEQSVFMDDVGDGRFTSSIAMGRHEVQYRILAGDAVSRWFSLKSVPRPYVVSFGKTFVFPEYTGRDPETKREETGDIATLIGTEVELAIAVDQPVETASAQLVTEKATNKLDFVRGGAANEWTLKLPPLADAGSFTVHVETAGGLDNKFRPEYSITVRPDLVPTLKVTEPKGQLTVRPEDILPIKGTAGDDVGLAKIEQLTKVDNDAWTTNELQLAQEPGTNVTFQLDWDLLKLAAKPGDNVLTKLAAVDLKGSRAESSPVRIKVDSAIFEADRLAALQRQRQWATNLIGAAEKTLEFHAALPADLVKFSLPGNDNQRRDTATEAVKALLAARTQWKSTRGRLPAILRKAHTGRESAGLGLIGRLAVRMDEDWLLRAREHLRPLEDIILKIGAPVHAEHLGPVLGEIKAAAEAARDTANGWLAADEAALALDLLDYVSRAAANMHRLAEAERDSDPKVWERLARRQGSVAKELEVALATLKPLADRLTGDEADAVKKIHDDLAAAHKTFTAKQEAAADESLLAAGRELEKAIFATTTALRPRTHTLATAAAGARGDLAKTVGPASEAIERLHASLEAREQAAKDYEQAKKDGEEILKAESKMKVAEGMLDREWTIAIGQLRGRAALVESGKATALFVSDIAQAARAIEAVRAGLDAGRDVREVLVQLESIAEAAATLEAAHQLAQLEAAIKALLARERWKKKATDANTLRPRDWQWLRQRLSATPEQLRAVGLSGVDELEVAANSAAAKAVGREMTDRKGQPGIFPVEKKEK